MTPTVKHTTDANSVGVTENSSQKCVLPSNENECSFEFVLMCKSVSSYINSWKLNLRF
jgi:hypothetical protein